MKNPFSPLSEQLKSFLGVLSVAVIVIVLSIGAVAYCKTQKPTIKADTVSVLANVDYYSATQVIKVNDKLEIGPCALVYFHLYVTSDTVILKNMQNASAQPLLGKPIKFVNNGATLIVKGIAGNYFTLTLSKTKPDDKGFSEYFMLLKPSEESIIVLSEHNSCALVKEIIAKQLAN